MLPPVTEILKNQLLFLKIYFIVILLLKNKVKELTLKKFYSGYLIMDIKCKIENSVKNVIIDELGAGTAPDKIKTIVEKITGSLSLSVHPDELVLLNLQMKEKTPTEMAVVSVIGQDSVGIVAEVTRILAENSANIEGMNQAIVSGYFALILTINVAGMNITIDELQTKMDEVADKKNLKIYIQHENIFKSMNRI